MFFGHSGKNAICIKICSVLISNFVFYRSTVDSKF